MSLTHIPVYYGLDNVVYLGSRVNTINPNDVIASRKKMSKPSEITPRTSFGTLYDIRGRKEKMRLHFEPRGFIFPKEGIMTSEWGSAQGLTPW